MSDMSTYLGDKLLNWLRGTAFGTAPTNIYAALFNGDPDSGGTEVTGTVNLARQAVTLTAPSGRASSNNAEINFGTANGSATVNYVALYDANAAGNRLSKKSVTSVGVDAGEKVAIASGDLDVTY